jgi:hypothetical protein
MKIYSVIVTEIKTGRKLIELGFYKSKESLRKNVNKTLTDLNERPERVHIEIETNYLID